jgi:hypothetical protein
MRRLAFLLFLFWPGIAIATPTSCDVLTKQVAATGSGPVFIASYPTAKIDQLRGVAFLYDNELAALALIGCGNAKAATQIGDAMLIALDHDRYWRDGRLRNAYLAGQLSASPVKLTGWWDKKQNMWVEDAYQVGSDTGNMAWTVLAFLALHKASGDARYLEGAKRVALYLEESFDTRTPRGYTGGTFGDEPKPVINLWKSTEHNTDIAAAFRELAVQTGDAHWRERADAAQSFVAAMWTPSCKCFITGTKPDGSPNPVLALDADLWPLLAIPAFATRYAAALDTANSRLRIRGGFSYSDAKDGVWTEGSAQGALLLELLGRTHQADALLKVARRNRLADGSYYASEPVHLPTGFMLDTDPTKPRLYFHLPHLAALAWMAMAQRRFNPFTATNALPN